MTAAVRLRPGPLVLDLQGPALAAQERERLRHPGAGGVILFARNYESPRQLARLTAEVRALREPPLLVAVDQEGGRVQRFREGFTRIPAMGDIGRLAARDAVLARRLARACGTVIGREIARCGVDFSFAPVLDLDYGRSAVIGERAFARDPQRVADLAGHFVRGLAAAGVAACAKHFPGHGWVAADSHLDLPVDERALGDIERADLVPFAKLLAQGVAAVMPAHVVYPRVDDRPAGFSPVWLKRILRERLGFGGLVFSDDLSMAGASTAGDVLGRARAALDAGCDMVLVCNDPPAAGELLEALRARPVAARRHAALRARTDRSGAQNAYAAALRVLRQALQQRLPAQGAPQ